VLRSSNHIFHDKENPIYKQGHTSGKIIIGNDVWIASNVVITDGAVIGHGSIISAGARVSKKFPKYSVIGGVNKIIKKR
jgi:acetyltransferase-like isoleucine patch superfamily enzyme